MAVRRRVVEYQARYPVSDESEFGLPSVSWMTMYLSFGRRARCVAL